MLMVTKTVSPSLTLYLSFAPNMRSEQFDYIDNQKGCEIEINPIHVKPLQTRAARYVVLGKQYLFIV